ncbi:hypothetical protein T439DRAFT_324280 [Meredithblackwellia eburnea MCA 4105]
MSGNLSHSMRSNYDTHGVSGYYTLVSESYRNPHFGGLKKVLGEFMDRFVEQEKPSIIRVLDLAAGSGEATEIILGWKSDRWPRNSPVAPSVEGSSPTQSASSTNPPSIPGPRQFPNRAFIPQKIKQIPKAQEPVVTITASDPFTAPGYFSRTGLPCLELSFSDVAAGKLPPPPPIPSLACSSDLSALNESIPPQAVNEQQDSDLPVELYDIVVISFALHLVESSSELWALLTELSKRCKWLVVTAPHKKPDIKPNWGWRRWDPKGWCPAAGRGNVGGKEGDGFEIVLDRTRLRVWRSEEHWQG